MGVCAPELNCVGRNSMLNVEQCGSRGRPSGTKFRSNILEIQMKPSTETTLT